MVVRMRGLRFLAFAVVIGCSLAACGPSVSSDDTGGDDTGDGGNGPDAYQGPRGGIAGTVWMPMHSPTQAPSDPIPVYGAVVYVTNIRPDPIPDGVFCERCVDAPASAVYTSHDGSFELSPIPGDYWLVIQKGQWRLEQQITVGTDDIVLTDDQTTLPSDHDPASGLYIPKVAIVLGTNDNIEDVLGKVGFDSMNGNDFVDVPGMEVVTLHARPQRIGAGSVLLEGAKTVGKQAGCRRLWLITTNDNQPAIDFYSKCGMRLVAIHKEAVTESRRIKPEIPLVGIGGVRITDELEFEIIL